MKNFTLIIAGILLLAIGANAVIAQTKQQPLTQSFKEKQAVVSDCDSENILGCMSALDKLFVQQLLEAPPETAKIGKVFANDVKTLDKENFYPYLKEISQKSEDALLIIVFLDSDKTFQQEQINALNAHAAYFKTTGVPAFYGQINIGENKDIQLPSILPDGTNAGIPAPGTIRIYKPGKQGEKNEVLQKDRLIKAYNNWADYEKEVGPVYEKKHCLGCETSGL